MGKYSASCLYCGKGITEIRDQLLKNMIVENQWVKHIQCPHCKKNILAFRESVILFKKR